MLSDVNMSWKTFVSLGYSNIIINLRDTGRRGANADATAIKARRRKARMIKFKEVASGVADFVSDLSRNCNATVEEWQQPTWRHHVGVEVIPKNGPLQRYRPFYVRTE